jgi:aspartyl protease family protein
MSSGSIGTAIMVAMLAAGGGLYLAARLEPPPGRPQPAAHPAPDAGMSFGGLRFRPAPAAAPPASPGTPAASGYGRVELRPDSAGQYRTDVEIEGRRIPMLVDTGATLVSLTFDDALKLGMAPAPADYTADIRTANGMAKAARITLREIRVGTLLVADVPALVMPRNISGTSLLGMSFLKKLGGFEIASGTLILRP